MNQLKSSVISAVVLNLVLYKVNAIYDTVLRKYQADFSDLGAGAQFTQAINLLKVDFIKNLGNFKHFVASQLAV